MSYSGFGTTKKGRELLAKMLAGETLAISKVMAGSGVVANEGDADLLNELVSPKMVGTSTKPSYVDDVMTMTLQFRSDMADEDFNLQEYGVFATDTVDGEILLYYANLGDSPLSLQGKTSKFWSVLDFHIAVTLGKDLEGVQTGYPPDAFVTHDKLTEHFEDVDAHKKLFHTRIQLAVDNNKPSGDGVHLWLTTPTDDNGTVLFQFPE